MDKNYLLASPTPYNTAVCTCLVHLIGVYGYSPPPLFSLLLVVFLLPLIGKPPFPFTSLLPSPTLLQASLPLYLLIYLLFIP